MNKCLLNTLNIENIMILRYCIFGCLRVPNKLSSLFWKKWNVFKFYIAGIKFGKGITVYNSVYVKFAKKTNVVIGDNFTFTSGNCINPLCRNIKGCLIAGPNARIIIGDNVGMSSTCIWSHKLIKIGNNVKIGGDVIIMDSDAHSLNYMDRRCDELDSKNTVHSEIEIGDDVLIGTKSIILKGVHIGAGTVIGSGSIVVKDIPAHCIAVGNPCKVIKYIDDKLNS